MSVDNSSIAAKRQVRALVSQWLGRPAPVLECFVGHGNMSPAWAGHERVGIDKKRDSVADHVGDNEVIGPRLAKSGRFRIFDLDAYGNPWRLYRNILAAVPPGRYGFAVTCGIRRGLFNGNGSRWLYQTIGIPTTVTVNLLHHYDDIIRIMLDVPGCRTSQCLRHAVKKQGASVQYFAIETIKE